MNSFWLSVGIVWKNVKLGLALAVGLLAPIKGLLILVGVFIVIDTVMGLWAAKKTKSAITSHKLSGVLTKMFIYQMIVIVAFALDKLILGEFTGIFTDINLLITKIATLLVLGNEFFSIDEKMRIIRDGKGIWYEFKRLIGVAKLIKKETKDIDIDEVKKLLKENKEEENGNIG